MKVKQFVICIVFIAFSINLNAQTGIGTSTPHASAKLEVASTTQGFLPPRVALTATNSASPVSNPANGLMVFNTTSAGASPFNVVPGYYYWDGTGQQWVSLSTTVGNVQNQALFRSSSNTSAGQAITSWNSRFNNIASGDLTITSLTEFVLSNGIYKIEWALPFQSSNTYNTLVLQELSSGSWGTFRGDAAYASLSNGGNTDWGGGTFAADILDCSLAPKTIRIINNDGSSRTLFKGVTLIITKLNPSITTSTTADNLGNHTATRNILLNGNFISNDGGNEGIRVDNSGNVGIGTTIPTNSIHVENGNVFGPDPGNTTSPSVYIYNNNNASTTAHSSLAIRTNGNGGGNPYLSFDIGGVRGYSMGIDNADGDKFKFYTNWNLNNSAAPAFTVTTDNRVGIGTTSPASRLHINSSDPTTLYIESTTSDNNGLVILNANTPSNWNVNHHEFMMFQKQGTTIGFIGAVANNNSINYSTTSDYRLKTDLQDYSGLNIVNKIKTYDYAWKNDNSRMYGVMAHELQEVIPYAVSGEKDAIDKAGKILPQAVDYSKLTPVLVKAIQEQDVKLKEQQLQIDALMKRLELLESKIK